MYIYINPKLFLKKDRHTVFSLFSSPGAYSFQDLWRGGAIGEGGLIEREAYLFIHKISYGDYLLEL